MQKFTESRHPGEHIVSEGNGAISREAITVASGQVLAAGTVLGRLTGSGEYAAYDQNASDGTETAAGVLYAAVDASAGAAAGVAHVRSCEVMDSALTYPDDLTGPESLQMLADLEAQDIIIR